MKERKQLKHEIPCFSIKHSGISQASVYGTTKKRQRKEGRRKERRQTQKRKAVGKEFINSSVALALS